MNIKHQKNKGLSLEKRGTNVQKNIAYCYFSEFVKGNKYSPGDVITYPLCQTLYKWEIKNSL